ncbi:hypothetical protein MMPV_003585 [Pyropia vietnamensis]
MAPAPRGGSLDAFVHPGGLVVAYAAGCTVVVAEGGNLTPLVVLPPPPCLWDGRYRGGGGDRIVTALAWRADDGGLAAAYGDVVVIYAPLSADDGHDDGDDDGDGGGGRQWRQGPPRLPTWRVDAVEAVLPVPLPPSTPANAEGAGGGGDSAGAPAVATLSWARARGGGKVPPWSSGGDDRSGGGNGGGGGSSSSIEVDWHVLLALPPPTPVPTVGGLSADGLLLAAAAAGGGEGLVWSITACVAAGVHRDSAVVRQTAVAAAAPSVSPPVSPSRLRAGGGALLASAAVFAELSFGRSGVASLDWKPRGGGRPALLSTDADGTLRLWAHVPPTAGTSVGGGGVGGSASPSDGGDGGGGSSGGVVVPFMAEVARGPHVERASRSAAVFVRCGGGGGAAEDESDAASTSTAGASPAGLATAGAVPRCARVRHWVARAAAGRLTVWTARGLDDRPAAAFARLMPAAATDGGGVPYPAGRPDCDAGGVLALVAVAPEPATAAAANAGVVRSYAISNGEQRLRSPEPPEPPSVATVFCLSRLGGGRAALAAGGIGSPRRLVDGPPPGLDGPGWGDPPRPTASTVHGDSDTTAAAVVVRWDTCPTTTTGRAVRARTAAGHVSPPVAFASRPTTARGGGWGAAAALATRGAVGDVVLWALAEGTGGRSGVMGRVGAPPLVPIATLPGVHAAVAWLPTPRTKAHKQERDDAPSPPLLLLGLTVADGKYGDGGGDGGGDGSDDGAHPPRLVLSAYAPPRGAAADRPPPAAYLDPRSLPVSAAPPPILLVVIPSRTLPSSSRGGESTAAAVAAGVVALVLGPTLAAAWVAPADLLAGSARGGGGGGIVWSPASLSVHGRRFGGLYTAAAAASVGVVAVGSADGCVRLYAVSAVGGDGGGDSGPSPVGVNLTELAFLGEADGPERPVTAVAVAPDGGSVAALRSDGSLAVWAREGERGGRGGTPQGWRFVFGSRGRHGAAAVAAVGGVDADGCISGGGGGGSGGGGSSGGGGAANGSGGSESGSDAGSDGPDGGGVGSGGLAWATDAAGVPLLAVATPTGGLDVLCLPPAGGGVWRVLAAACGVADRHRGERGGPRVCAAAVAAATTAAVLASASAHAASPVAALGPGLLVAAIGETLAVARPALPPGGAAAAAALPPACNRPLRGRALGGTATAGAARPNGVPAGSAVAAATATAAADTATAADTAAAADAATASSYAPGPALLGALLAGGRVWQTTAALTALASAVTTAVAAGQYAVTPPPPSLAVILSTAAAAAEASVGGRAPTVVAVVAAVSGGEGGGDGGFKASPFGWSSGGAAGGGDGGASSAFLMTGGATRGRNTFAELMARARAAEDPDADAADDALGGDSRGGKDSNDARLDRFTRLVGRASVRVAGLSPPQVAAAAALAAAVVEVRATTAAMDPPAAAYTLAAAATLRAGGELPAGVAALALHCSSADALLGHFAPAPSLGGGWGGEPTAAVALWPTLRRIGGGWWAARSPATARVVAERSGRAAFAASGRDPDAAALWFIVTNKTAALSALYAARGSERMAAFLRRDFRAASHRGAAAKNAYVLLSKHRLEMAAAFFVLAGDAPGAVTLVRRRLGDEQLALLLARLLDGGELPPLVGTAPGPGEGGGSALPSPRTATMVAASPSLVQGSPKPSAGLFAATLEAVASDAAAGRRRHAQAMALWLRGDHGGALAAAAAAGVDGDPVEVVRVGGGGGEDGGNAAPPPSRPSVASAARLSAHGRGVAAVVVAGAAPLPAPPPPPPLPPLAPPRAAVALGHVAALAARPPLRGTPAASAAVATTRQRAAATLPPAPALRALLANLADLDDEEPAAPGGGGSGSDSSDGSGGSGSECATDEDWTVGRMDTSAMQAGALPVGDAPIATATAARRGRQHPPRHRCRRMVASTAAAATSRLLARRAVEAADAATTRAIAGGSAVPAASPSGPSPDATAGRAREHLPASPSGATAVATALSAAAAADVAAAAASGLGAVAAVAAARSAAADLAVAGRVDAAAAVAVAALRHASAAATATTTTTAAEAEGGIPSPGAASTFGGDTGSSRGETGSGSVVWRRAAAAAAATLQAVLADAARDAVVAAHSALRRPPPQSVGGDSTATAAAAATAAALVTQLGRVRGALAVVATADGLPALRRAAAAATAAGSAAVAAADAVGDVGRWVGVAAADARFGSGGGSWCGGGGGGVVEPWMAGTGTAVGGLSAEGTAALLLVCDVERGALALAFAVTYLIGDWAGMAACLRACEEGGDGGAGEGGEEATATANGGAAAAAGGGGGGDGVGVDVATLEDLRFAASSPAVLAVVPDVTLRRHRRRPSMRLVAPPPVPPPALCPSRVSSSAVAKERLVADGGGAGGGGGDNGDLPPIAGSIDGVDGVGVLDGVGDSGGGGGGGGAASPALAAIGGVGAPLHAALGAAATAYVAAHISAHAATGAKRRRLAAGLRASSAVNGGIGRRGDGGGSANGGGGGGCLWGSSIRGGGNGGCSPGGSGFRDGRPGSASSAVPSPPSLSSSESLSSLTTASVVSLPSAVRTEGGVAPRSASQALLVAAAVAPPPTAAAADCDGAPGHLAAAEALEHAAADAVLRWVPLAMVGSAAGVAVSGTATRACTLPPFPRGVAAGDAQRGANAFAALWRTLGRLPEYAPSLSDAATVVAAHADAVCAGMAAAAAAAAGHGVKGGGHGAPEGGTDPSDAAPGAAAPSVTATSATNDDAASRRRFLQRRLATRTGGVGTAAAAAADADAADYLFRAYPVRFSGAATGRWSGRGRSTTLLSQGGALLRALTVASSDPPAVVVAGASGLTEVLPSSYTAVPPGFRAHYAAQGGRRHGSRGEGGGGGATSRLGRPAATGGTRRSGGRRSASPAVFGFHAGLDASDGSDTETVAAAAAAAAAAADAGGVTAVAAAAAAAAAVAAPRSRPPLTHSSSASALADGVTSAAGGAAAAVGRARPRAVWRHEVDVTTLASHPLRRRYASGGTDGVVRLWDFGDAVSVGALRARHFGRVEQLAYSAYGTALAAVYASGRLILWRGADSGVPSATVVHAYGSRRASGAVLLDEQHTVAAVGDPGGVSSGGGAAAVGHSLRVYDVRAHTRRAVWSARVHGEAGEARAVALLADGLRLVTGGVDGRLGVVDVRTRTAVATLPAHGDEVVALAAEAPRGRALVSGCRDGGVAVWDARTLLRLDELRGAHPPTRHYWSGSGLGGLVGSHGVTGVALTDLKVWGPGWGPGWEDFDHTVV